MRVGYPVGLRFTEVAIAPPEPASVLPPLPRAPTRRRRVFDVGLVFALTWMILALGVTLVWGPDLGLRGWAWLGVHHVLCGVGCTHEIRRAWLRRRSGGRIGQ